MTGEVLVGIREALADRYTIEREIGRGGMATVYLAEDLKHHRKVAVKVLKPELAAILGTERFLKEIEVTANLQHPHILPLYDSGQSDSFLYYVMPHVEDESLREKLDREKQLSVTETVEIAKSVAAALDYAHQHSVIHRDIKPENILLQTGQALVADFGIALAVSAAAGTRLTETGLSLGTPHYMSPEQAMADRELDARSDVYSLGAVVYEMLVGEPPHVGNSAQAIVAKILSDTPAPISRTRELVPVNVDAAVRCALAKSPADRFSSAADFSAALLNPAFALPTAAGVTTTEHREGLWKRVAVVATAIAAVVAVWALWHPSTPAEVSRWTVNLPSDQQLAVSHFDHPIAVSPDGRQIAFVTEHRGVRQLYLRGLNEFQARPIPGTEDASNPFFSPDGQSVAFFGQGQLKRVSVAGGRPISICDASGLGLGGSWGANDTIVFSLLTEGLRRVSASGGVDEELAGTGADSTVNYMTWPRHLAGRAEVLVTMSSRVGFRIAAVSLEGRGVRVLGALGEAIGAVYLPTGDLVYSQAGVLLAVPFDLETLEPSGAPVPLLDSVATSPGGSATYFAVSHTGSLLYVPARASGRKLVWVDREGRITPISEDRADFHGPHLSLDGQRLVVIIVDEGSFDIWIYDVERGTRTRSTSGYQANDAMWTPDGTRITFTSFDRVSGDLAWKSADGTGTPEALLMQEQVQVPHSWSPDGETLAFYEIHPETFRDIWILPRNGEARPFVRTPFEERSPSFSPDGRWIAYVSNESGRDEVYVAPYPGPGERHQVSPSGGRGPAWSRDGELFYRNGDQMMSVRVRTLPSFVAETPTVLFEESFFAEFGPNGSRDFSVSSDGQRFVMIQSEPATKIYVVLNWFEELKERMGQGND